MLTSNIMLLTSAPLRDIFFCPEESNFYAHCLETLVLNSCPDSESIVEFGSGDGSPVIKAILNSDFDGKVHGFEISKPAAEAAKSKIEKCGLEHHYFIHNRSFFDSPRPQANYLVSNPPYLPAWDNNLYQPGLHGGINGITVTKKLLSLDYENVLVMASSYGDPEALLDYAIAQDYTIKNFLISPLPFGYYSSEPKVKNRISELKQQKRAFCTENVYLLAGVLFSKQTDFNADLSDEFTRLMTAL